MCLHQILKHRSKIVDNSVHCLQRYQTDFVQMAWLGTVINLHTDYKFPKWSKLWIKFEIKSTVNASVYWYLLRHSHRDSSHQNLYCCQIEGFALFCNHMGKPQAYTFMFPIFFGEMYVIQEKNVGARIKRFSITWAEKTCPRCEAINVRFLKAQFCILNCIPLRFVSTLLSIFPHWNFQPITSATSIPR